MAYENLCMSCMKEKGNAEQCPHCHFHNDSLQLPPFLPMRTIVGGHYLIGAVMESNGDGTTYMGYDTEKNTPVTVREFLPDTKVIRSSTSADLLVREGQETSYQSLKASFLDLWSRLQKMSGLSALVVVLDIIEENNTAYVISEYVEGAQSLRDYLLSTKSGYLSWKDARIMFMPALSTLATLHSNGIIHRGISPQTLYVYPDHKVRISGFSIPECRMVNGGLTTEVFPGYTPVEQLGVQSAAGPWTDIYSFAAVLYRALIGRAPIDALTRMDNDEMMIPEEFARKLPNNVINALVNSLQVLPEDRTRNVDRFRAELSDSQVAEFASAYEEEEKARKRRKFSQQDQTEEENEEPTIPITNVKDAASGSNKNSKRTKTIITCIIAALVIALVATLAVLAAQGKLFGNSSSKTETTTEADDTETVTVPQFVGQTISSIQSSSTYTDNFNISTTEEYSDTVQEGVVIEQNFAAGTSVDKGTTITLTVSRGPESITMPDVTGMTQAKATSQLEGLGFTVSSTTKTNDGTETSGTVASTSLTAGQTYSKGSNVTLIIWGEPETTTTTTTSVSDAVSSAVESLTGIFNNN